MVAPISITLIKPEMRRRIYWTNVPIHTKVSVLDRGQEGPSTYPNRAPLDLPRRNAMKAITAPIPFARSQLDLTRHFCPFLGADEGC